MLNTSGDAFFTTRTRNRSPIQVLGGNKHILVKRKASAGLKVHLTSCGETEVLEILTARAANSTSHELTASPAAADLVLLVGNFAWHPHFLLEHPAYRQFPEKCAAYTEDDNYLPLVPGVYCSATEGRSTQIGRACSYTYVTRNGHYQNSYLSEANREMWNEIAASTPKKYLFTFQGGSTSMVRKRMFNLRFDRPDVLIQNTAHYYHWDDSQPDRLDRQRAYAEILAASEFVLCPRGAGLGSIRFFEAMAAGVAPVLISDRYVLPPGPNWDSFLLRLRERDISRLPELIEPHRNEAQLRGRLAGEAFQEHFSVKREFDRIVELAAGALRNSAPYETAFRRQQSIMIRQMRWRNSLRDVARSVALKTMKALGVRNPYQMNR